MELKNIKKILTPLEFIGQDPSLKHDYNKKNMHTEQPFSGCIEKRKTSVIRQTLENYYDNLIHKGWLFKNDGGKIWALSNTKLLIDSFLAGVLLVLLFPLLGLIALLIKLDSSGPVFFRQERTGFLGRRFILFKFRTMVNGADKMKCRIKHLNHHDTESPDFKAVNDPRITLIGKVLRKSSLDELPNLINVFLGEMRLVGPRPTSFNTQTYPPEALSRLIVPPGITGYWQINGRSDVDFADRTLMDQYYIRKQSPLFDLTILLKTVIVVLKGKGSY